jgi:uncharacterized protein (TIGR02145 family)
MINAHPFKLKGGLPLGGTYSGPGVDPATGIFYPNIAGTGIKTITYSYTNSGQCSAAASRSITVAVDPAFVCGGMLTDVRETANPNSYPTVQIGNQCWMAANLNYGSYLQSSGQQTDNCQVEKFCYNDNQNNCTQFGGLYQWDELLQYQETPGVQGICPPGWHIPSEAEWGELFSFYGGKEYAGEYLLAAYGHPGFVAKPAGVFYSHQTWSLSDLATFFWTSTRTDPFKALSHGMTIKDKSVSLYSSVRGNAFSVRCVKD